MKNRIIFVVSVLLGSSIMMMALSAKAGLDALLQSGATAFQPAFNAALERYMTVGNVITAMVITALICGVTMLLVFITSKSQH